MSNFKEGIKDTKEWLKHFDDGELWNCDYFEILNEQPIYTAYQEENEAFAKRYYMIEDRIFEYSDKGINEVVRDGNKVIEIPNFMIISGKPR